MVKTLSATLENLKIPQNTKKKKKPKMKVIHGPVI